MLLNVAMFDGPRRLDALLEIAAHERGEVFIGIVLSPAEVHVVQEHLGHARREISAWVVGRRQRRPKGKPENKQKSR